MVHYNSIYFIFREINQAKLDPDEVDARMNRDRTTCCVSKKRPIQAKPPVPLQITAPRPVPQRKRSPSSSSDGPQAKRVSVFPASALLGSGGMAPKPTTSATNTSPARNSDLVCTPDILSMFMDDEPQAAPAIHKTPQRVLNAPGPPPLTTIRQYPSMQQQLQSSSPALVRTPNFQTIQPMVLNQQQVLQQVQPRIVGPAPVYHTINGYRIDLNTAAQQNTFRLPNGKLIQVKKQVPPVVQQQIQTRPHMLQVTQRGPNPNFVNVRYQTQNIMMQAPRPMNGQVRPVHQMTPGLIQTPPRPTVTGLPLKPQPTVLQKPNHPPTPLGTARNAFETKVYNTLEISHQIIGKINILANNSSYKNVRHLKDLKELYIHLSYLITYAQGRFKAVQDKCNEELKALGFEDAKETEKDSQEGDIEVIDTPAPLIEIDDDDDEASIPTFVTEKNYFPSTSTKKTTPKKSPLKALGVETDDPKLKIFPVIKIHRVETIMPEIMDQLLEIKQEKEDTPPPDEEPSCNDLVIISRTNLAPDERTPSPDEITSKSKSPVPTEEPSTETEESNKDTTDKAVVIDEDLEIIESSDPLVGSKASTSSTKDKGKDYKESEEQNVPSSEKIASQANSPKPTEESSSEKQQPDKDSTEKMILIDEDLEMVESSDPLTESNATSSEATSSKKSEEHDITVVDKVLGDTDDENEENQKETANSEDEDMEIGDVLDAVSVILNEHPAAFNLDEKSTTDVSSEPEKLANEPPDTSQNEPDTDKAIEKSIDPPPENTETTATEKANRNSNELESTTENGDQPATSADSVELNPPNPATTKDSNYCETITLEDVDVDVAPSEGNNESDSIKNAVSIVDFELAESDLTALADSIGQESWNI